MRYEMRPLAERCAAAFHRGSIGSVDPDARRARTHDDEEVGYDHLVVACGSRLLAGVPGAVTFWGVADDGDVRDVVRDLSAGKLRRIAFTMPGGGTWALPLYELALLAERELATAGIEGTSLVLVTPEDAPLDIFGRAASDRVGELLDERGIEVITGATPVKFDGEVLTVSPSAAIEADAVLGMPRIEGRRIAGIPHDADGFVAVDDYGGIRGIEHAYAAGDVTSFPVKQGGIATQQADLVAESIASELGCEVEPKPLDPVIRGVLWTGAKPLFLCGHLAGGHGETSVASEEPPWEGAGQGKIVSRYLTGLLGQVDTDALKS
jgi:sulfide:quinone oxidoreductase